MFCHTQPTYFYEKHTRASSTDRNKEGTCAVRALEKAICPIRRKETQPRVIAIEDELSAFGSNLREPCILGGQSSARATLVEVKDEVGEGGYGACG